MERTLKNKSVNYHITEKCNMACNFCFAKFNCKTELTTLEAETVIDHIADNGADKINLAGGEPFLRHDLGHLIMHAATKGLMIGVITNGSLLTTEWLTQYGKYLNWLGVSIDSVTHETNFRSGRHCGTSKPQDVMQLCSVLNFAKTVGISIKINTVVSQYNLHEDLNDFIRKVSPDRWKIFQVLPIENANQNDSNFEITDAEYHCYLTRHEETTRIFDTFTENNRLMRDSYIMIDPEGRFYDNSKGSYSFSDPILEIGVEKAFSQIEYNHSTFLERGGKTAISRSNEKAS